MPRLLSRILHGGSFLLQVFGYEKGAAPGLGDDAFVSFFVLCQPLTESDASDQLRYHVLQKFLVWDLFPVGEVRRCPLPSRELLYDA